MTVEYLRALSEDVLRVLAVLPARCEKKHGQVTRYPCVMGVVRQIWLHFDVVVGVYSLTQTGGVTVWNLIVFLSALTTV